MWILELNSPACDSFLICYLLFPFRTNRILFIPGIEIFFMRKVSE